MKGRILGALVAAALLSVAAPASATHVTCGQTITVSTRLDSDVNCPSTFTQYGLWIGADDVTLHLGHFTIRAGTPGLGGVGVAGGTRENPLSNVTVRGGSIEGFVYGGVGMFADNSSAIGLTTTSRGGGIDFFGDGNEALLNDITIEQTGQSRGGIRFAGNDAYAARNTIHGGQVGIGSFIPAAGGANNPRIAVNTIENCEQQGIYVDGYTDSAIVARNTVTGCNTGIQVQTANPGAGGAEVRRNLVSQNSDGIRVSDPASYVWCNTASDNRSGDGFFGEGIVVSGGELKENTATGSVGYGIRAEPGTTDGGGNAAGGNGTSATDDECTINIVCSAPPSTCPRTAP